MVEIRKVIIAIIICLAISGIVGYFITKNLLDVNDVNAMKQSNSAKKVRNIDEYFLEYCVVDFNEGGKKVLGTSRNHEDIFYLIDLIDDETNKSSLQSNGRQPIITAEGKQIVIKIAPIGQENNTEAAVVEYVYISNDNKYATTDNKKFFDLTESMKNYFK